MSIFEQEIFTLYELCKEFYSFIELQDIISCYLFFTSNHSNYRLYLQQSRQNKGIICFSDTKQKYISFREILQIFDPDFNKLMIRIHVNPRIYTIHISWTDFDQYDIGITKEKLYTISKQVTLPCLKDL